MQLKSLIPLDNQLKNQQTRVMINYPCTKYSEVGIILDTKNIYK